MTTVDHRRLAAGLLDPVRRAGAAILAHRAEGVAAERKADASPVTEADRTAEAILLAALARIAPGVPVVAEEAMAAGRGAEPGERFFLVDPLDGTKEFVSGESDFTVNVALAVAGVPRFGLVYAPALAALYVTVGEDEAAKATLEPAGHGGFDDLPLARLRTRPAPPKLTATVSRSHLNAATADFLATLPVGEKLIAGSSLKFCRIAEGVADVYPRLAPTMEWDTAAGDAVLRAAGGTVRDEAGHPLRYGKAREGFRNPGFVAWGRAPAPD